MKIKLSLLTIFFCFMLNTNKAQALNNQQILSRIGLSAGILTTVIGIHNTGFINFPQMLLGLWKPRTKIGKKLKSTVKSKVDKHSYNAYKIILSGLILTGISYQNLK